MMKLVVYYGGETSPIVILWSKLARISATLSIINKGREGWNRKDTPFISSSIMNKSTSLVLIALFVAVRLVFCDFLFT